MLSEKLAAQDRVGPRINLVALAFRKPARLVLLARSRLSIGSMSAVVHRITTARAGKGSVRKRFALLYGESTHAALRFFRVSRASTRSR